MHTSANSATFSRKVLAQTMLSVTISVQKLTFCAATANRVIANCLFAMQAKSGMGHATGKACGSERFGPETSEGV